MKRIMKSLQDFGIVEFSFSFQLYKESKVTKPRILGSRFDNHFIDSINLGMHNGSQRVI